MQQFNSTVTMRRYLMLKSLKKGKDVDLYSASHVQDTSNAHLRHWNWAARPLFNVCNCNTVYLSGQKQKTSPTRRQTDGLMEFAGVDKAARSKMGVWKKQEWTYRHDMARVDTGHCGNGQCGTIWQGWTLEEWTCGTILARVDNAGGKNVSKVG